MPSETYVFYMQTKLRHPYSRFFGTLANQYRIDIIELLKDGDRNVNQICKKLNYNQTTVSHNLKRLEICGFVKVNQKGKERIYTLNQKTIKPLLNLMHNHMRDYCCKIKDD